MPFSLATNRRPPATAGCARAARTPGNPNAHFNFSFGTSAAVNPPLLAGWNRAFATPAPQPFHDGPELGLDIAGADAHRPVDASDAPPTARPVTNSATSRRSASVSFSPWIRMLPLVSALTIASGAKVASVAGFGARESAAGFT